MTFGVLVAVLDTDVVTDEVPVEDSLVVPEVVWDEVSDVVAVPD